MVRKKKAGSENIHPVFYLFFLVALALCLLGMAMAFVICIDRADELFNNVRYQNNWHEADRSFYKNRWQPFQGNFVECVKQIPHGFYIGFSKFPAAALVAMIFYPLLVFVVPVYDIAMHVDFTFLILGWLPFAGGVLLFILSGLLAQMSKAPPVMKAPEDSFNKGS